MKGTLEKDAPFKEYPAHGRDDLIKQIISIKARFQNYKLFAAADMDSVLNKTMMKDALTLEANFMQSALIKNNGKKGFEVIALPDVAQRSVVNAMIADDFNGDGMIDLFMNTNDYSADPNVGRYDALNGLVLMGNGDCTFSPLSMLQSGVTITGNGKALTKLLNAKGEYLVAATQNRGPMLMFKLRLLNQHAIRWKVDDAYAITEMTNGKKIKTEAFFGDSFLSQSSRFFNVGTGVKTCTVYNKKGQARNISF
jgi:hypothetical protein